MKTLSSSSIFSCSFSSWQKDAGLLLEKSGLGKIIGKDRTVLLKPNLVEIIAPPVTTPVSLVADIVEYLLDYLPPSQIFIGEGCGATGYDTHHVFSELGYNKFYSKYGIELIDLNTQKVSRRENPACRRWPELYLPEILDEVFLLSVPQLKAHSLAGVTLTMKNMIGCAPPSHYKSGGAWKKATFHRNIHDAIFELNRYRTPDFTVLDASIGMAQAHLWGPRCIPPVDTIAASFDPVAIDSYGTHLLGRNWKEIDHIVLANGELGMAEGYEVIRRY